MLTWQVEISVAAFWSRLRLLLLGSSSHIGESLLSLLVGLRRIYLFNVKRILARGFEWILRFWNALPRSFLGSRRRGLVFINAVQSFKHFLNFDPLFTRFKPELVAFALLLENFHNFSNIFAFLAENQAIVLSHLEEGALDQFIIEEILGFLICKTS